MILSGDIFNRDMEFDLGDVYHVTRFRMDCRLADVMDHVTEAANLMVGYVFNYINFINFLFSLC